MKRVVCVMKNVNPLRYLTYNVLKSHLIFVTAKAVDNTVFSDAVFVPSQSLNNVFLSSLDFPSVNVVLSTLLNEVVVFPPPVNISELINVVSDPLLGLEFHSSSSLSFVDAVSAKLFFSVSDTVTFNSVGNVELTLLVSEDVRVTDEHLFNVVLTSLNNIQVIESVTYKHCVVLNEEFVLRSTANLVITILVAVSETVSITSSASISTEYVLQSESMLRVNEGVTYKYLISVSDAVAFNSVSNVELTLTGVVSIYVTDEHLFNVILNALSNIQVIESVTYKHCVVLNEEFVLRSTANLVITLLVDLTESVNLMSSASISTEYVLQSESTVRVNESIIYKYLISVSEAVRVSSSASVRTG